MDFSIGSDKLLKDDVLQASESVHVTKGGKWYQYDGLTPFDIRHLSALASIYVMHEKVAQRKITRVKEVDSKLQPSYNILHVFDVADGNRGKWKPVTQYANDISSAFQLLDQIKTRGMLADITLSNMQDVPETLCSVHIRSGNSNGCDISNKVLARSDKLPIAICMACLHWVGGTMEPGSIPQIPWRDSDNQLTDSEPHYESVARAMDQTDAIARVMAGSLK